VADIYRTVEPTPDTPQNHRKTRRSRKPQETPTPDPKAQQSARLCSLLRCRRTHFAPSFAHSGAAAAPILLPLALPPLPFCSLFCSLLRCRRSHFAPCFAPSRAAAALIMLPLLRPLALPPLSICSHFCSLLRCRRSHFAPSFAACCAAAAPNVLPLVLPLVLPSRNHSQRALLCEHHVVLSRVVFGSTTDGLGVGGICRTIRQTTTMAAQTVLVRTMLGMMARGFELLWRG
jgi:hypothetical protein